MAADRDGGAFACILCIDLHFWNPTAHVDLPLRIRISRTEFVEAQSWAIGVSQLNREIGTSVATASIWVDADACPKVIKEILFRAAERTGVTVTLVANQPLVIPRVPSLRLLQVTAGFDVADNEIVKRAAPGDLVITADVPLAAEIIAKGGEALNPRGERYSPDTIRGVLTMRDFMDTMRASGHVGGGPPALTQADRNAFASHLDKWLVRSAKG